MEEIYKSGQGTLCSRDTSFRPLTCPFLGGVLNPKTKILVEHQEDFCFYDISVTEFTILNSDLNPVAVNALSASLDIDKK